VARRGDAKRARLFKVTRQGPGAAPGAKSVVYYCLVVAVIVFSAAMLTATMMLVDFNVKTENKIH